MRLVSAIAILALIGVAAACEGRGSRPNPIDPTPNVITPPPPPGPPAPAPPVAGVSSAVLVMSNIRATETQPRPNEPFYYNAKFLLTEITAKSGATITNIRVSAGSDSDNTGPSCWRDPIRVAPGGTLDAFDAGWEALLYCAPFVGSRVPLSSVSVLVSYVDDDGRAGNVAATIDVTR